MAAATSAIINVLNSQEVPEPHSIFLAALTIGGFVALGGAGMRMVSRQVSRESAFTLVELLVVIAIMSILLGLCCRPYKRPAKLRDVRLSE